MDQVRSWLYISGIRDTRNLDLLQAAGIGAMLQLADEVKQPGITTLFLPVDDGASLRLDLLKRGVEFVRAQKAAGQTMLVACGAGVSRSSTFVVASLREEEGLSLAEALKQLYLNHRDAFPDAVLWRSLCQYYEGRDISRADAAHEVQDILYDVRPNL